MLEGRRQAAGSINRSVIALRDYTIGLLLLLLKLQYLATILSIDCGKDFTRVYPRGKGLSLMTSTVGRPGGW
jgi:hypothetical protein